MLANPSGDSCYKRAIHGSLGGFSCPFAGLGAHTCAQSRCLWLDRQPLAGVFRQTWPYALHKAVTFNNRSHQEPMTVLYSFRCSFRCCPSPSPTDEKCSPESIPGQQQNRQYVNPKEQPGANPRCPDSVDMVLDSTSQHYTTTLVAQVILTKPCTTFWFLGTCTLFDTALT